MRLAGFAVCGRVNVVVVIVLTTDVVTNAADVMTDAITKFVVVVLASDVCN